MEESVKSIILKHKLSDEKVELAKTVFDIFDKDGGGSISVAELDEALIEMGVVTTQEELALLIEKFD